MTLLAPEQIKKLGLSNFVANSLACQNEKDFQIFQLAGDASSRKYFRVVHNDKSYVLMSWEAFPENINEYPLLSVLTHFEKHNIHTPKIIATSPKEGFILQEDLGDLTLERKFWENQNQEASLPFYKMAIDELIKIHYKASSDKTDCSAFNVSFDTEKLLWELNYAKKYLLEGLCAINLSPAENISLAKNFQSICESLNNQDRYICHRDYHSRNLMIKFGKVRVIDFQDARMGPVQYDLVSLLKDSYVDLNSEMTEELLKYYLDERAKIHTPISDLKYFEHVYEIQSVQRCFKACGSFASFYVMRKDTRYLKYLSQTLQRVRISMQKLGLYSEFLDILQDHKVFEKDYMKLTNEQAS